MRKSLKKKRIYTKPVRVSKKKRKAMQKKKRFEKGTVDLNSKEDI